MCLFLYASLLRTLVIDLHAKIQNNICMGMEKSGKLFHLWNILSARWVTSQKINEVQRNSNLISKSWWLTYMQKNQVNVYKCLEKKAQKTVWSLKFTKSKARNFAKNQWSITKLKLDL